MASQEEVAKGLRVAEQEMDYRVDLFNRMVSTCFDKCMDRRYKEGELNVGETACIDRCASKYWQVTGIVGQLLGGQGAMGQ